MEYREIVAVTGLGGLYQLLTTKSDGAIVRSVADKSTKFISARQHNVTPLESIEVYTTGDNVRLQEVFKKMLNQEADVKPVDTKTADSDAIKNYFKTIFPEFDEDRVYVSDMKKMLKWYELLKSNDLLRFEEPQEENNEEKSANAEGEPATAEEAKAETPAATAAENEMVAAERAPDVPKKTAKKKKADSEGGENSAEEAPVKKTAKKKKRMTLNNSAESAGSSMI